MKSLLKSTALLYIIVMVIATSCSKEEENLFDKVQSDVSNIQWLATDGADCYELTFSNDKYTLKYDLSNGDSYQVTGAYSQNKSLITFQEKQFTTYSIMTLKTGEITKASFMNVPVYYDHSYADTDIAFTLKFTPVE